MIIQSSQILQDGQGNNLLVTVVTPGAGVSPVISRLGNAATGFDLVHGTTHLTLAAFDVGVGTAWTFRLRIGDPVDSSMSFLLSYTKPSGGNIADSSSADMLETFSGYVVANNLPTSPHTVYLNARPADLAANSYATVEDATTYLEGNRAYASKWTAATWDEQAAALIWGSKLLDICFRWNGKRRHVVQPMRWPRAGVRDADNYWIDYDSIPVLVFQATCEMALSLLTRDRTEEPAILGYGMGEISLEGLRVWVDSKQRIPIIPQHVPAFLMPLGEQIAGFANGTGEVRLVRT